MARPAAWGCTRSGKRDEPVARCRSCERRWLAHANVGARSVAQRIPECRAWLSPFALYPLQGTPMVHPQGCPKGCRVPRAGVPWGQTAQGGGWDEARFSQQGEGTGFAAELRLGSSLAQP